MSNLPPSSRVWLITGCSSGLGPCPGILWPTDFDERIRVPFDLHAHHWKLRGLEINRGYSKSDLGPAGFKGRAHRPASHLHQAALMQHCPRLFL